MKKQRQRLQPPQLLPKSDLDQQSCHSLLAESEGDSDSYLNVPCIKFKSILILFLKLDEQS